MKKIDIEQFNLRNMKFRYIFCTAFIVISINVFAINCNKKKEYPVVSTTQFEFMDSIVSMVSQTNLRQIYSFSNYGVDKEHKPEDFIYNLTIYQQDYNSNEWKKPSYEIKEQDFRADGTYMLTVSAYLFIPDTENNIFKGYIFNYRGLKFFSDTYLRGFFKKVMDKTFCKYQFDTGYGYSWTFKIEEGKLVEAYAYYSLSEPPFKVLDIINDEIINYDSNLKLY